MLRNVLIALVVLTAGCLFASRAEAVGFVNTNIFSDFTPPKAGCPPTCSSTDGSPYSGFVGSINTTGVTFATDNAFHWHPFSQVDFGADIKGPLNVSSTGVYTFGLNSDDGSRLFIDGNPIPIIDNGGPHGPTLVNGSTLLTAGIHSFEVRFFECCNANPSGDSGVDLIVPDGVALTPEPSTIALMAPGMVGLGWFWRRRKAA
jgi:hypothetical protein